MDDDSGTPNFFGHLHMKFNTFIFSMDWFKGKFAGNHGFPHFFYGAFRLKFSLKPIH